MALVTYDNAAQQLEVEATFAITIDYYIGLTFTSGNWQWANGTVLGSGIVPSNADPYAHWGHAANTSFAGNAALTFARATATAAYSVYTGDGTAAQQIAVFYNNTAANKTHGWIPVSGTTSQAYVCRGSEAVLYPCPPAPPPLPPPPPPITSFCEYHQSLSDPRQCQSACMAQQMLIVYKLAAQSATNALGSSLKGQNAA
jgi:hypothetical protein